MGSPPEPLRDTPEGKKKLRQQGGRGTGTDESREGGQGRREAGVRVMRRQTSDKGRVASEELRITVGRGGR